MTPNVTSPGILLCSVLLMDIVFMTWLVMFLVIILLKTCTIINRIKTRSCSCIHENPSLINIFEGLSSTLQEESVCLQSKILSFKMSILKRKCSCLEKWTKITSDFKSPVHSIVFLELLWLSFSSREDSWNEF